MVSEIMGFYEVKGVRHTTGGTKVCVNECVLSSYHKQQEYIWFRGGDPNGFWDIRLLMK